MVRREHVEDVVEVIARMQEGVAELELDCGDSASLNHLMGSQQDVDRMTFRVDLEEVYILETDFPADLVDRCHLDRLGTSSDIGLIPMQRCGRGTHFREKKIDRAACFPNRGLPDMHLRVVMVLRLQCQEAGVLRLEREDTQVAARNHAARGFDVLAIVCVNVKYDERKEYG